jgi:small subunit ribosomal protein S9
MLYNAIGKRKTSVAKVFLKEGTGVITINKKSFIDFFAGVENERDLLKKSFTLVNLTDKYDVDIDVKGGGITGQLDAIKLAIAKAICTINNDYRPILNQSFLLRRDSRIKERRKYGLKKARKASQYSKR